MNNYHQAHYDLNELKRLIQNDKTRIITSIAQKNAFAIGYLTDEEIVEICLLLTKKDFYKTMTTHFDHTLWQDVYKPCIDNCKLYIKLQMDKNNKGVIISFKMSDD